MSRSTTQPISVPKPKYRCQDLWIRWSTGHFQFCPKHLSLKVPNIKFDVDVSVDCRHCLTEKSKSNLTLGTQLHTMMFGFDLSVHLCWKPNIEYKFDVLYFLGYGSVTTNFISVHFFKLSDPIATSKNAQQGFNSVKDLSNKVFN